MRRPLVSPSHGFTRPMHTLVREWHRLASCAKRNLQSSRSGSSTRLGRRRTTGSWNAQHRSPRTRSG